MTRDAIHIVFSGGGTGGHLFPGLAVAEQFAAAMPRARITFCGGGKPFERKYVGRAGFEYLALPARPLPHGAREAVAFVVENLAGYLAAGRFLREEHVAAVVGLGGYASVPMARAATHAACRWCCWNRTPSPAGPRAGWPAGRRWSARPSTQTAGLRCRCPVRVTGNPVRAEFFEGGRGKRKWAGESLQSHCIIHHPSSPSPIP